MAARELAQRVRESNGLLAAPAYQGMLLSITAMIIRNAVFLAVLNRAALYVSAAPFILMFAASIGLGFLHKRTIARPGEEASASFINVTSPFSLKSVLFFGLVLAIIQMAGAIGQQTFGQYGIYVTSFIGSLFSSSSAIAGAATLASQGKISSDAAGISAVIASITSAFVNLLFMTGVNNRLLIIRLIWAVLAIGVLGGLGLAIYFFFIPQLVF